MTNRINFRIKNNRDSDMTIFIEPGQNTTLILIPEKSCQIVAQVRDDLDTLDVQVGEGTVTINKGQGVSIEVFNADCKKWWP